MVQEVWPQSAATRYQLPSLATEIVKTENQLLCVEDLRLHVTINNIHTITLSTTEGKSFWCRNVNKIQSVCFLT